MDKLVEAGFGSAVPRFKNRETIIEKLRREPIKLSKIADLVGCRFGWASSRRRASCTSQRI
jgi:hypothetical protein